MGGPFRATRSKLRSAADTREMFGAQLRKWRTALDLSKREMATHLGWTENRYRHLEDGRVLADVHELYTFSCLTGLRAGDLLHSRELKPDNIRLSIHSVRIKGWAERTGMTRQVVPALESLADLLEQIAINCPNARSFGQDGEIPGGQNAEPE